MRAYFIDPEAQEITPIKYDGSIKTMQDLVGATLDFVRINSENDRIALADRGRIDGCVHGYYKVSSYPTPLAGRSMVFGVDYQGEDRDATVSLEWLKANVTFLGLFLSGLGTVERTAPPAAGYDSHTIIDPREALPLNEQTLAQLDFTGRTCEEASALSVSRYVACGRVATVLIKGRDPRPYFMCDQCGDHNLKNRGPAEVLARAKVTA